MNRPDATAETIVEDGWLRTGDIGKVDGGYFFITDRLKELSGYPSCACQTSPSASCSPPSVLPTVKFSGLQVAPAELEALILSHPSILDTAVIPLPHPESGEVPKAYCVLKPGQQPFDLESWVAERVSPHKKIRGGVEWTGEIPKSPSGKILRRVLVDLEKERAGKVGKAKL